MYVYLRKIDLSIDRCKWTSWDALREYYQEEKIKPDEFALFLLKKTNLVYDSTDLCDLSLEVSCSKMFVSALLSHFRRKYYLKISEIRFCCKLLFQFNDYFSLDFEEYTVAQDKLRVEAAKLATVLSL